MTVLLYSKLEKTMLKCVLTRVRSEAGIIQRVYVPTIAAISGSTPSPAITGSENHCKMKTGRQRMRMNAMLLTAYFGRRSLRPAPIAPGTTVLK